MPKMVNQDNVTRIHLRTDVNRSLNYYMHEKGAIISGVPGATMNKQSVVNQILINALAAEGHYPPKDEVD